MRGGLICSFFDSDFGFHDSISDGINRECEKLQDNAVLVRSTRELVFDLEPLR